MLLPFGRRQQTSGSLRSRSTPLEVGGQRAEEKPNVRTRQAIRIFTACFALAVTCLGQKASQRSVAGTAPQKINCESCQSSILIIVDRQCKLRVDAQPLGAVAAGESKLVKLDPGDHIIEAQAEDLKWERTVQIVKPGQTIVKTGLSSLKAASRWVGEWIGGTDYGEVTFRNGDSIQYSHYFERFIFRVTREGGCTVTHETTFDNDFKGPNESEYALVQRVAARARTAHLGSRTLQCTVTPEGPLDSDWPVSTEGDLTFAKVFADRGRVTVRLQRSASQLESVQERKTVDGNE